MRAIVISIVLASCFDPVSAAFAQEAEPFHTRNLNPAVAIFGLPTWEGVTGERVLTAATEIANHYRLSQRGGETLILDGETTRVNLFYSQPIGERWAIGAELALIRQSGGVLDDLIDGWHSAFGMPDGGRNNRPEGELLFLMARNGQPFYRLDDGGGGVGDLQVSIARRLADDRFVVRASVKIPTGSERILAGSGSRDGSLTLLQPRTGMLRGGRAAGYFWGIGVLTLGDPERIEFAAHDRAIVGVVGGGLKLFPRIGMKAQIDVHSAMYETALEEIGQDAVQATIGGWWEIGERRRLDFAVSEDLHVSTAPDVVLHVALRWQW